MNLDETEDDDMMIKRLPGFVLSAICVIALAGCAGGYGNAGGAAALAGASTGSATVEESSANSEESAATIEQSSATVEQGSAGAAAQAPANVEQAASAISEDEARKIALQHAGLDEGDVTFIKSHPDYEDGRYVYDVEFYKGLAEYDYEIDAYSGAIMSYDFDIEGYAVAPNEAAPAAGASTSSATVGESSVTAAAPAAPVAQGPAPAPAQAPAASAGTITLDEAKKIALKQAGISSENSVIFTETSFEYDDGRAEYQIDFIYGTTEYEVEIDATTGAIIEYDVESIYD